VPVVAARRGLDHALLRGDELSRAHYAQVRSDLQATGLPIGLLVNFAKESADFRRIEVNKKSP
jgi:hypothetical protein